MTTVPYTFGNESSPIPLSQLDANFAITPNYANTAGNIVNAIQANITSVGTLTSLSVTGTVQSGNLLTQGRVSATGNAVAGNISTGGTVSAYGSVTGGSFTTTGAISATGSISTASGLSVVGGITAGGAVTATGNVTTAGNITASGNFTNGGNITTTGRISAQGNISAQGVINASGNITTTQYFVGNFLGNITGNLSVGGSNTQILFNQNGNVGATSGLTYNKDSNVLTILGTVSAQTNGEFGGNLIVDKNLSVYGNVVLSNNISATGNLTIGGTGQYTGIISAQTPIVGTSNNQVATTAFVTATVGSLGSMARQDSTSVAITGGTIGNAIITLASVSNSTITSSRITNTTVDKVTMVGGWSVTPVGSTLYFSYGGTNLASLDSAGNFVTIGDVTAFGSV